MKDVRFDKFIIHACDFMEEYRCILNDRDRSTDLLQAGFSDNDNRQLLFAMASLERALSELTKTKKVVEK